MTKKKILIVDDEQTITKLLKFVLEKTGIYELMCENESLKALEVIRSVRPDLLILDINMPGVSGAEISEILKKDASFKDTPILFLTGNVSDEESEMGLMIDGHPTLSKPINMERLLDVIAKNIR